MKLLKEALLGLALMYTSCSVPQQDIQDYSRTQETSQQLGLETIHETTIDDNVAQVTADNFDRVVLQSGTPVVVDFYADWCGHCQTMERPYQEAAQAMSSRMTFTKYNIDSDHAIPRRYDIRGIPTFIVFDDGREICRVVGSRENIQHDLENCLD